MDDRRELTVRLTRAGDTLRREHLFGDYQAIRTSEIAWSSLGAGFACLGATGIDAVARLLDRGEASELVQHFTEGKLTEVGGVLFQALFGAVEIWEPVLRAIFEVKSADARPNPTFRPVRLRVLTTDPVLSGLPWRTTAWEGKRLIDNDWTFEVTTEATASYNVNMPTPCKILAIAPRVKGMPDVGTDAHLTDLRERLGRISVRYEEPAFLQVIDQAELLESTLRGMQPEIVYYFGHAEVTGGGLTCLCLCDAAGKRRLLSMADFKRAMHPTYPMVVCVNGCMSGASGWHSAGHQLVPEVRAVIANRTTAWTEHAGPAAIAWLAACLGDGLDPVMALDRLPATASTRGFQWATTTIHTGYKRWSVSAEITPPPPRKVGLRLDRDAQRGEMSRRVAELCRSQSRKVEAIVAYGAPGNQMNSASEQFTDYLELFNTDAHVKPISLSFPERREALVKGLLHSLRGDLKLPPQAVLEHALRDKAPSAFGPARAVPVLWLDWGTFGAKLRPKLTLGQIGEWLEFCAGELSASCPREIRIVSFLSVETEEANHKKVDEKWTEFQETFPDERFGCALIGPFPPLKLGHLMEYLRDPSNTQCPQGMAVEMAKLVHAKTGGNYDATVGLINEAEDEGWHALRRKLKGEDKASPAEDDAL